MCVCTRRRQWGMIIRPANPTDADALLASDRKLNVRLSLTAHTELLEFRRLLVADLQTRRGAKPDIYNYQGGESTSGIHYSLLITCKGRN